jgi:hypothetical protein
VTKKVGVFVRFSCAASAHLGLFPVSFNVLLMIMLQKTDTNGTVKESWPDTTEALKSKNFKFKTRRLIFLF